MAKGKQENKEYAQLKKDLASGVVKGCYIFHGEERYLLEYYVGELRKAVLGGINEEFNLKRLEGKDIPLEDISEAVDMLPVFAQRTLVEIYDYDIFGKGDERKEKLAEILSDLPEYVCVVFIYDTIEYKPDGRMKINAALKKLCTVVEFRQQEQSDLTAWIARRFRALSKNIDRGTAEYLAFVSGGLMTRLVTEVEKLSAYTGENIVTRRDIDAVVEPVIDAVTYKMTDAALKRDYATAAKILGDLLSAQEVPQVIIYGISQKMRQLLAARACVEEGKNANDLMELCGIRFEFQAQVLMSAARRTDMLWCRKAVLLCSGAALRLNSGGDGKETLSQLIAELAAG